MSDWNFYKDYYKGQYLNMLEGFKNKINENKIKITKDNVSEYFDIEKTWTGKKYKLKDGFLLFSGREEDPINPDWITYVLKKSFYSAINISYNLNLGCLCTEIREKIKRLYGEELEEREIIRMFEFQSWILRMLE